MRNLRLARALLVIIYAATVAACTTPALVRPIGTIGGSTKYRVSCPQQDACDAAIAKTCATGHFDLGAKPSKPMFVDIVCALPRQGNSEGAKRQPIQILIAPECKNMLYGPDFPAGASDRLRPDTVQWDPARAKPFAYKDPRSAISLYVESDGRHLAAIDSNGRLLWIRNPFEDAGLCPYRSPHPVIYEIEVAESLPDFGERAAPYLQKLGMLPTHTYVRIHFDSSQYGLVDETSGSFFLEGQN
jgi:hypothetical protein